MSGSHARPTRQAVRLAQSEPDQVPRLLAFRAAHPDVIVGAGEFGTWQARIPEPNGETVVNRYRLCELLNRLDELTGQHHDQAGGDTG